MKHVDENGFWVYEANPISRVGVFPYLGSQIDRDGSLGLVPNKVYKVFRSPDFLFSEEAMKSFNGKPFIDEHEMLGKGFTSVDDRPADGAIYNVRPSVDNPGVLLADFTIYTDSFKRKLESGKREISLGYYCDYVQEPGEYQGEKYDFIQTNMRGNHVALVNRGRMGAGVRVCDHALTFDSIEGIPEMKTETDTANVAAALADCLKGADDERCKRLLDFLAKDLEANPAEKAPAPAPDGQPAEDCGKAKPTKDGEPPVPPPPTEKKDDDDDGDGKPADGASAPAPAGEGKPEDKPLIPVDTEAKPTAEEPAPITEKTPEQPAPADPDGKPADGAPAPADGDGHPAEDGKDGKPCNGKKDCKDGKCGKHKEPPTSPFSEDQLQELCKEIRRDYARANSLADALAPFIGAFDHSEMTERDVAKYACDKLDLDPADGQELASIRGFLAGTGRRQPATTFTVDSSDSPKAEVSPTDTCLRQYLG